MSHLNRFQRCCVVSTLLAIAFFCVCPPWQVTYCITADSGNVSDCVIVWRPIWESPGEIYGSVLGAAMSRVKAEHAQWEKKVRAHNSDNWTPIQSGRPHAKPAPGLNKLSDVATLATGRLVLVNLALCAICAFLCIARPR